MSTIKFPARMFMAAWTSESSLSGRFKKAIMLSRPKLVVIAGRPVTIKPKKQQKKQNSRVANQFKSIFTKKK